MNDFKKDYYKILEIDQNATAAEIKLAYRRQAKKYHPDLHPNQTEYKVLIQEINEAYGVLEDENEKYVYDQYLINKKAYEESEAITNKHSSNNQRTYTKSTVVYTEERTYLKGIVFIKYSGKHDERNAENILRETFYNLTITKIDAVIQSSDILKDQQEGAEDYKNIIDKYSKSGIRIKHPVNCAIHDQNHVKYYNLDILNLTIPAPEIIKVTKHEGKSFGTITGTFYGYIKEIKPHEEEVEVTECYGETGRREEKVENEVEYYRKEYFNTDCTRYWGNWIAVVPTPTNKPTGTTENKGNYSRVQYYYSDYKKTYWGKWTYRKSTATLANDGCFGPTINLFGILLSALFILFLIPQLIFILPFIVLLFLLNLLPIRFWNWLSAMIFGVWCLFLLLIVVGTIVNINRGGGHDLTLEPKPVKAKVTSVQESIPSNNSSGETLIAHHISWNDYNGKTYEGNFSVKKSEFTQAHLYKDRLSILADNDNNYDRVIFSLKEYDKDHLEGLYSLFDSLKTSNKLSRMDFAEMMVTFVQSIPYTLILPDACNANLYQDNFISGYLASDNARCYGYQKYGINTPVEFLATLDGDCDSRTLLLYTAFAHYGYDVVLLSSSHYGHSLIGINLPYEGQAFNYNNQRYVFWETTAGNVKPGILPYQFSNSSYWRISLKST